MSGHAAYWIEYYNSLEDKVKNSFHGKWLKDKIALCIGKPFPAFVFPDANGKQLVLKDIVV